MKKTAFVLFVFLVAANTAFASVITTCVAGPAGQASCWGAVAPDGTFLQYDNTSPHVDTVVAPTFFDLTSLGFSVGDSLVVTANGLVNYGASGLIDPQLNAAFVASTTLAGDQLNRLDFTGISTPFPTGGTAIATSNTYYGGLSTDIAQDFVVTIGGVSVVIPAGAHYLAVGFPDSWYADNATGAIGTSSELGVSLQGVPEPGTWALVVAGLGALGLGRLRRAR